MSEQIVQYLKKEDPLNNLEEFTLVAMQGLLAGNSVHNDNVPKEAVKIAMATLIELHKTLGQ